MLTRRKKLVCFIHNIRLYKGREGLSNNCNIHKTKKYSTTIMISIKPSGLKASNNSVKKSFTWKKKIIPEGMQTATATREKSNIFLIFSPSWRRIPTQAPKRPKGQIWKVWKGPELALEAKYSSKYNWFW